ncbi:MAG: group I intron-associated PD-(D/E)XK endonuclease [Actinomycetota bacterium]|nr:group I intron-associated PD-(D/E)XK endonuclease [Actinomycetota bacterium]
MDVGHRTEAIIILELVRRGFKVLTPLGVNQRYDLGIESGSSFLRVQFQDG